MFNNNIWVKPLYFTTLLLVFLHSLDPLYNLSIFAFMVIIGDRSRWIRLFRQPITNRNHWLYYITCRWSTVQINHCSQTLIFFLPLVKIWLQRATAFISICWGSVPWTVEPTGWFPFPGFHTNFMPALLKVSAFGRYIISLVCTQFIVSLVFNQSCVNVLNCLVTLVHFSSQSCELQKFWE